MADDRLEDVPEKWRKRAGQVLGAVDSIHDEVTEAVDKTIRIYLLQQKAKGVRVDIASFAVGRALVVLGMTYAGVALGLEAEPTLSIVNDAMAKLQAERKKVRGDQFMQPPE